MKDKSHLANLIAFYNEMAGYVDKEGAAETKILTSVQLLK